MRMILSKNKEKYIERLFWLTINAYHESRGEPDAGVKAICKVVLNRTKSKRWPNSVKGVILQSHQFSWTLNKTLYPLKDYLGLLRCAKLSFVAHSEWVSGMRLSGADHYHGDSIGFPLWTEKMERIKRIGKHVFYKSK